MEKSTLKHNISWLNIVVFEHTKIRMIVNVVTIAVLMSSPPNTKVTMKTAPSEILRLIAVSSTIVRYCS